VRRAHREQNEERYVQYFMYSDDNPPIPLQSRQLLGRIQCLCDPSTEDSAVTFTRNHIAAFRPKAESVRQSSNCTSIARLEVV
jgi:hypothetical protein